MKNQIKNRIFIKSCVKSKQQNGENYYNHFGIRPVTCCLYGDNPEDIINVKYKIHEDQSKPEHDKRLSGPDYWGWFDNDDNDFASFIQPQLFMLNMCFTYGYEVEVKAGKGQVYRLEIISEEKYEE